MTTPEQGSLDPTALALPPLPPLGRFSQDFHRMRVMQDGAWCPYDDVKAIDDAREARERILVSHADDLQRQLTAALARIAELQEEADRRTREVEATYHVQKKLNARIAELDAVCAGHYANAVEALRQANEADAKALAFEADAERYRWLRKNQLLAKIHYMPTPQPEHLDAAIDAHEPPFTHEFFVVMQKRRTGPIYPDLHKTNERIYFTEEDANRALDADPELKPYRHVVRMAAFVATKENDDD